MLQVSLSGSRNEPCFSKLPSNHSCVSRDVTCCSSNKKQFSPTTLNNKRQKSAGNDQSLKNFSEPLYFYRPFGDSSVISSSILNPNECRLPPLHWFVVGVGEGKVRNMFCDTYRKSWWTTHCSFLFFFVNICTVMFFQKLDKDWTVSVSFGLCQTHLRYTKAHSILGDQIAYTVGHGAPGTFELMNYHLLHVKCHCTFMSLEQDEFSISAARLSQIFSQWQDNVIFLPKSIGSENQNLLYPKIPLAR